MTSTKLPPNIQEFNEITGVILAQLYGAHPMAKTIEPDEIAETLGWPRQGTLPSGRTFNDMFAHTISWLAHQNFIYPNGSHPRERVQLTSKALVAMNVVPSSLGRSRGTELVEATKQASSAKGREWVGEIISSITEGITKGILNTGQ